MKNLVLGVAKGYDWYVLEPFVNSFAKNCPSAELVLFVDDISDFTRDKLLRGGVLIENFPYKIDGIPNNTRWKLFRDFLDVHGDEYEQIFITDTRDVIFQFDVFECFKGLSNWLGCVTEGDDLAGSKTGNRVNYTWLEACFGKTEADKLADQKIICCGTIIGSAAEMKTFCRELWKILEHKTGEIFDQAVTNYLAYNGLLPIKNLYEIDVLSGEIFTIHLFSHYNEVEIRDGMILRGDGGIPSVVHQYDRHENLINLVDENYRDKNLSLDERFNDPRSLLEQSCCLLLAGKTSDIAEILSRAVSTGVNLRSHIDTLLKIWKFVTDKPFTRQIEVIELAVQNALFSFGVEKISSVQMTRIQEILILSAKNNHPVDNRRKFAFANRLLELVKDALERLSAAECFFFINLINQLELPPDKNFYLVVAKANRIFGRKDEALAAYKKVLDLS